MIGHRLKELRMEKGYSLRKLSRMTGISHGFLCDVEQERSNPTIAKLQILASALGVSPRDFFEEDEK